MSTKITYNGKTTELADGYIATLPCKDYKMETDIVIEAPDGSGGANVELQEKSVTNTQNGTTEVIPDEGKALSKVTIITAVQSSGDDVEFKIVVAVDSGATVTATKGSTKVSGTSVNGTCTLIVPEEGAWTVTATIDGVSATSQTIVVSSAFNATIEHTKAILYVIADAGAVVTCSQGDKTRTATIVDAPAKFYLYTFGEWTITATLNGATKTDTVSVVAGNEYTRDLSSGAPTTLELTSWEIISEVSAEGTAANYWTVGDTKEIVVNGTVGTVSINERWSVYIIGFDHNGDNGIHFGTFKNADSKDIALSDSKYNTEISDGGKHFNFNHWNGFNYGGWKGSDLRYDILGSTNVAPSGYGSAPTTSRVGNDATTTCATNPVSNTLMAALPTDLRAVMKPMTIYTDNIGNRGTDASSVTASIDYLPLLAAYEVTGSLAPYANPHEHLKQAQYAYFMAGNSKVKYKHSSTGTATHWWTRTVYSGGAKHFHYISTNGSVTYKDGGNSFSISPIFKV